MNPNLKRQRFLELLESSQYSCASLARAAGLSTPNALYNFINGHSNDLDYKTIEKIAPCLGVQTQSFWRDRIDLGKTETKKKVTCTPLVGIYPGTFDPITLGHLDIIERALKVVDHLIVAIADSEGKVPLFSVKQRVAMAKTDMSNNKKIKGKSWEVVSFDNLLMNFVQEKGARVIVRGLRAVSDFEYEFQMAGMNSYLNDDIETMFLMAQDKHQLISSRFIKEIAKLGGDVSHFVTPPVAKALKKRFSK